MFVLVIVALIALVIITNLQISKHRSQEGLPDDSESRDPFLDPVTNESDTLDAFGNVASPTMDSLLCEKAAASYFEED